MRELLAENGDINPSSVAEGAQLWESWPTGKKSRVRDFMTFVGAVADASALGVSLVPEVGEAYILPEWSKEDKANIWSLRLSFRGMIRVAQESDPNIKYIDTEVAYEGERFEVSKGTNPAVIHDLKPDMRDGSLEKAKAFYTVVMFKDGQTPKIEVVSAEEVRDIRSCSKAQGGPWKNFPTEMGKKVCTRRAMKQLRLTGAAQKALGHENKADSRSGEYADKPAKPAPKTSEFMSEIGAVSGGGGQGG